MNQVKTAVIPVAGLGTRLLPASKSIPKEMIPVVDKPIIQHVVEEAVEAGITRIVLVTRSGKESIENHFDRQPELEAELERKGKAGLLRSIRDIVPGTVEILSVRQPRAAGLGDAIRCAAAMVLFSFLCILLGVAPQLLYQYLPYPVDYEAYTAGKVVFYLQLLLFSGLAFFLLLPLMRRTETISLDADWLWRFGFVRLARATEATWSWLRDALARKLGRLGQQLTAGGRRFFGSRIENGELLHGLFARAWPIGTTALWIAVLLTTYVLFYYLS